jgi:predicted dehydrogenase
MPVVSNEAEVYGYTAENRHMVESFLSGKRPLENFDDGLDVTRLLMAAYMSAEQSTTIKLPNPEIENFIPAVSKGEWNPKK